MKETEGLRGLAPLAASKDLGARRALLTQALEIRRRVLPESHPDIATNLGARARDAIKRNDLEGARELYRQAFAVFVIRASATTRAISALEHMKDPNDGYALASARTTQVQLLSRMGRPKEAAAPARAALALFERWGHDNPSYAAAECELGRAKVLQGAIAEGRAALARCLPIYRAWGQADREIIESIERLLAEVK